MSGNTTTPDEPELKHGPERKFYRRPELRARYGFSDSTLYRWIAAKRFPPPVKLGPNLVAWRDSELNRFDADPEGWTETYCKEAD